MRAPALLLLLLGACAGVGDPVAALRDTPPAGAGAEARAALKRLAQILPARPERIPEAVPVVVRLFAATPWHLTRVRALFTLGTALAVLRDRPQFPQREALLATLRRTFATALKDPAPPVRAAAATVLGASPLPGGEALLLEALRREEERDVRRRLFRSLERYRTPRVARALLRILTDGKNPLDTLLARRALLAFTGRHLGEDPAAWRRALAAAGYLPPPQSPR